MFCGNILDCSLLSSGECCFPVVRLPVFGCVFGEELDCPSYYLFFSKNHSFLMDFDDYLR